MGRRAPRAEISEDDVVITVTVLVATRERESLLPGCLASLLRQTMVHRTEILVIDNHLGHASHLPHPSTTASTSGSRKNR